MVADRLELGELDVEPVAHGIGAGLGERVSTVQRAALDSGQRERDPLARLGSVDRLVVHLDAAHPHVDPGRLGPQLVARADRARPQRSRDDGADPVQGEGAVDVEPRRAEQRLVLEAVGDRHERCTELVEPLAGLGADLDHSRGRYELPRFARHQLELQTRHEEVETIRVLFATNIPQVLERSRKGEQVGLGRFGEMVDAFAIG